MSRIILVIWILCFVAAFSCRQEYRSLSDDARASVVGDVEALFDSYFAAVKKNGLTAEFEYLDHSPDFFWVPPGYNHPISYDSVEAVLTCSAARYLSVENTMDSLRIIPLNSELATYTAILRSVMKDTSGNISSLQLIESGVVIKRSNGWKLLNGQTSLIKP